MLAPLHRVASQVRWRVLFCQTLLVPALCIRHCALPSDAVQLRSYWP